MKLLLKLLLASGATTAVLVVYPDLVLWGLLLFILPGLFIMAAPSMFAYGWMVAAGIAAGAGRPRWAAVAAIITLVALLGALPALWLNSRIDSIANQLSSEDHTVDRPLDAGIRIALLERGRELGWEALACSNLCQRLLYGGEVKEVLVQNLEPGKEWPSAAFPAAGFRIERRRACPQVAVDEVSAGVRARISAGQCLVSFQARLDQASAVVAHRVVQSAPHPGDARPRRLDPRSGIVSSDRYIALVNEGGSMREVFRRTETMIEPLFVPLVFYPKATGDANSGFDAHNSFLVKEQRLAGEGGPQTLETVLRTVFGLRLAKIAGPDAAAMRSTLAEALSDRELAIGDARFLITKDVLTDIAQNGPQAGDDRLVARLISDGRADRALSGLPDAVERMQPPLASLAAVLVERLSAIPNPDLARTLSLAAKRLPPGTFAAQAPRLAQIARNPEQRAQAYLALTRLADGGTAELGAIVELATIDWQASPERETQLGEARARSAGLYALCVLGSKASSAAPALLQRLSSLDPVEKDGALVATLVHLGQADELRARLSAGSLAKWASAVIARASRPQSKCIDEIVVW